MSRLTVTEKEHWKNRIERRIQKAIDLLKAKDPHFFTKVKEQADLKAQQFLGTFELSATLKSIDSEMEDLRNQKSSIECEIYSKALGVPSNRVNNSWTYESQFKTLLNKRSENIEQELLAASEIGQELIRLNQEKEALLDTIWLATSNKQIRDLWTRVASVVGDDATSLQADIIAATDQD